MPTSRLGRTRLQEARYRFLAHGAAPAGTPRPIVDKLNTALRARSPDATVQRPLPTAHGFVSPEEETPEAAHALLKHEIKLWHDVITANKIAAQ